MSGDPVPYEFKAVAAVVPGTHSRFSSATAADRPLPSDRHWHRLCSAIALNTLLPPTSPPLAQSPSSPPSLPLGDLQARGPGDWRAFPPEAATRTSSADYLQPTMEGKLKCYCHDCRQAIAGYELVSRATWFRHGNNRPRSSKQRKLHAGPVGCGPGGLGSASSPTQSTDNSARSAVGGDIAGVGRITVAVCGPRGAAGPNQVSVGGPSNHGITHNAAGWTAGVQQVAAAAAEEAEEESELSDGDAEEGSSDAGSDTRLFLDDLPLNLDDNECWMLTEAGIRMLKKALARRTPTRTGTTKTSTRKKSP